MVIAAALLVACSKSSHSSPAALCTNVATVEAPPPYPTAAILPSDDELHCRIRGAMLTIDDLPAGWARTRFVGDPGADHLDSAPSANNFECAKVAGLIGGLQTGFEPHPIEKSRGQLSEYVLVFGSGEANGFMAEQRKLLTPDHVLCSDDVITSLDAGAFGDESVAYASVSRPGVAHPFNYEFVAIRRGDVVAMVSNSRAGSGTLSTDAFARLADAKIAPEAAALNAKDRCGTPIARLAAVWTKC